MATKPAAIEDDKKPIEQPEIDKEVEAEVVVAQPDDDGSDDAAAELQQQIAELKKSEGLLKSRAERAEQERAEALRREQERSAEIDTLKKQTSKSEYDSISSALAAAQAIAEKASNDIEAAMANQDAKALAEATRRLSRAEADIGRLETGKVELEERAAEAKANPPRQPINDPLENTNLPQQAKDWLRAHPDYISDHRKNAKIQSLHWDVIDEGHRPFSTAYFESLETHLGLREADDDEPVEPKKGKVMVSAPVTRTVPGSSSGRRNGKVEISAAEKEIADAAGITVEEYAKQKARLAEEKASGNYGGAP